ncbi:hypothetical protein C3L33_22836, partial [Rhododendron williamsianum]
MLIKNFAGAGRKRLILLLLLLPLLLFPVICRGNENQEFINSFLHLPSGEYYVQSIDYADYSIRLVDVGIQTNDTCSSFPLSSSTFLYFTIGGGVGPYYAQGWSSFAFLSCENPVQSPIYINTTGYCDIGDHPGKVYYSYAVAGDVSLWDVADSCVLEGFTFHRCSGSEKGGRICHGWISIRSWGTDFRLRGVRVDSSAAACAGKRLPASGIL